MEAKQLATQGLAGKKVGKHVVRKERTEVQLGEDLSESLRGLKVRFPKFVLFPVVLFLPKKYDDDYNEAKY